MEQQSHESHLLDAKQIIEYVEDLRSLLGEGVFAEQKTFLRFFIKRIDYEQDQLAISYTIPMPIDLNKVASEEVLSMEPNSRPCRSRTCDTLIKSLAIELVC
jgi:hypothetical protein